MSASCERAIEVEDMILGLGAEDDLAAHVETCADCKDAREMFLAERELFAARPAAPPPPLQPIVRRAAPVIPLRAYAARVFPALAGLAAAVAALAVGHPFGGSLRAECETNTPVAIAPAADEPLTCDSRGVSAPAPAMTLASNGGRRPPRPLTPERAPICVASDRATCDLPESLSVTSSFATP